MQVRLHVDRINGVNSLVSKELFEHSRNDL